MRRSSVHLLFGLAVLAIGTFAATQWWALQRADAIRDAMAQAASTAASAPVAAEASRTQPAEAVLTSARVLAGVGRTDEAVRLYNGLIQAPATPALMRQAALYNLGTLYLRQGLQSSGDALAPLELAKQRYRDVLRASPQDWDARYNLERALRLAPEPEDGAQDNQAPAEVRRIRLGGMQAPDLP